jgi:two-component sensor histidine kinase
MPMLIFAQQKSPAAEPKQVRRYYYNDIRYWFRRNYDLLVIKDKSDLQKAKDLSYELKYEQAIEMFKKVIQQRQQKKGSDSGASVLRSMATVYTYMNRIPESISCLQEALKINKIKNNKFGIYMMEEDLSEAYYTYGKYDSALYFANKCVLESSKEDIHSYRFRSACDLKLAALIKLNRADEIDVDIMHYMQLVNSKKKYNDYLLVGNYYLAKGLQEESRLQYDSAINFAKGPGQLANVYGSMASSYYQNEDFKKSYDCLQESVKYIKEYRNLLENMRKEQVNVRDEARLTLVRYIGIGALLILGLIIFYQLKARRKTVIIKKQNEELQILMKEIHHRVKNNLQIISSLLDLQSHSIKDSLAYEAIKEGKNRVQSMALIHQNLYGERSIQSINIKEYIHDLSEGLITSYNIKPGIIKVNMDIDDLNLDVDTVIPLGLILNELISNSLKHAFKNGQQGEIQITLKESDNLLHLIVKDNGQGFSSDTNFISSTSFGMKLIKSFSMKLKAKLKMSNENGACVALDIQKYKIA